jgi:hypothetical protein
MFNPTALVIDAFVEELKQAYIGTYTNLEPDYPGIIAYVGHMALELIANSDAPYHDLSHTICVTLVGQEVIKGKHLRQGGVSPRDWLHFIISLLCHDIGYVRGICSHDGGGRYVVNANEETIALPPGGTDASLTPYHVERGKLFVRERFSKYRTIGVDSVCANISTRGFRCQRITGGGRIQISGIATGVRTSSDSGRPELHAEDRPSSWNSLKPAWPTSSATRRRRVVPHPRSFGRR